MFVLVYDWQWIQPAIFISHSKFFIFIVSAGRNAKANVNFNNWSFHISNMWQMFLAPCPHTWCVELLSTVTQSKQMSLRSIIFSFSFFFSVCGVECVPTSISFYLFFYTNLKALWMKGHENQHSQTTFTLVRTLFRCIFLILFMKGATFAWTRLRLLTSQFVCADEY